MEIKTLPLSQLTPADYHPRHMPDAEREKLRRSIEEFGYVEPIIIGAGLRVRGKGGNGQARRRPGAGEGHKEAYAA